MIIIKFFLQILAMVGETKLKQILYTIKILYFKGFYAVRP